MANLTAAEENALRFYIGDARGDGFFGDPKAYVILNSLFFPDIISESARAAEGKHLNAAAFDDIPRLLGFFDDLFSAFRKAELEEDAVTYRVERMTDFELCRKTGATVSMTSTSLVGFLGAYRDRRGIALMRFILPKGSPCIDAAKVLNLYAKPEEAEILLPPFMGLKISEIPLTKEERAITDCDGAPPVISCTARVTGLLKGERSVEKLPDMDGAAQRVCHALNRGEMPQNSDIPAYSRWKTALRSMLMKKINGQF